MLQRLFCFDTSKKRMNNPRKVKKVLGNRLFLPSLSHVYKPNVILPIPAKTISGNDVKQSIDGDLTTSSLEKKKLKDLNENTPKSNGGFKNMDPVHRRSNEISLNHPKIYLGLPRMINQTNKVHDAPKYDMIKKDDINLFNLPSKTSDSQKGRSLRKMRIPKDEQKDNKLQRKHSKLLLTPVTLINKPNMAQTDPLFNTIKVERTNSMNRRMSEVDKRKIPNFKEYKEGELKSSCCCCCKPSKKRWKNPHKFKKVLLTYSRPSNDSKRFESIKKRNNTMLMQVPPKRIEKKASSSFASDSSKSSKSSENSTKASEITTKPKQMASHPIEMISKSTGITDKSTGTTDKSTEMISKMSSKENIFKAKGFSTESLSEENDFKSNLKQKDNQIKSERKTFSSKGISKIPICRGFLEDKCKRKRYYSQNYIFNYPYVRPNYLDHYNGYNCPKKSCGNYCEPAYTCIKVCYQPISNRFLYST